MTHNLMDPPAPPTPPAFGPEIQKQLEMYSEDMAILHEAQQKLKELAAGIKNHGNVMYEVIQVFALYGDTQGGQIKTLSDVDNLDSTLRSKLSAAQSDMNHMLDGNFKDKSGNSYAKDMTDQVGQIEAFIKYEQGQGSSSILDQASLGNLQSAIDSIKGGFSNWGNSDSMQEDVNNWIDLSKKGQNVPQLKTVQDGFQTVNQSVSELSSTTNTQLQFVENQYKQGLGEENSAMQSYQKMNSNTIRHYTGN